MNKFSSRFVEKGSTSEKLFYSDLKSVAKFLQACRHYLLSYGFNDSKQCEPFFDGLKIEVKGHAPCYLNLEEILSFGTGNALNILSLEEASLIPSFATNGKSKDNYSACLRFSFKRKNDRAYLLLGSNVHKKKPQDEIFFESYIGISTDDSSFGEYFRDFAIDAGGTMGLMLLNEWYESAGWGSQIFLENRKNVKINAKKPKLAPDNAWLLKYFPQFFSSLDEEAKKLVVGRIYEYSANKSKIIKYLCDKYPNITIEPNK